MFGNLTILIALASLAMLSAGGVAYAVLHGRIQAEDRMSERLARLQGSGSSATSPDLSRARNVDPVRRRKSIQDTLKEVDDREKAKAKKNRAPPLALRLEQAGLGWSRQTFFVISAITGVVPFLIAWVLGAPIYVALAFLVVGMLGLPRWVVNFLRKRRMQKFLNEFANAIDIIVRGVKAGLPLGECVRIIALEAEEPVKTEFRKITEAQALGIPLGEAVAKMPERMPVPEARFFSIVITIQQKAGGNLAEALGNLSRVLRERRKMKGKIKAMSMEAKASAYIIGALPLIVMVLVYLSSPSYIALLFTETIGNVILGASMVWMLCGIFVMRKMVAFDF